MSNSGYKENFIEYLSCEKKMARNSLEAYGRDIGEFISFAESRGNGNVAELTGTEIIAYLHSLKSMGRSSSTVNRKLASVRAFFNYMMKEGYVSSNPAIDIKSPKIEKKTIDYLQVKDMERLLSTPDDSFKGKRDRAILEVLYATGMRVSEIIETDVIDVNLRMGFITCGVNNMAKARIVPLGRPARNALVDYIDNGRPALVKGDGSIEALFVNVNGDRITRQGIWKMLREYGQKAGLEIKLTPNIIRNSFAVHMLQNGADLKSLQEMMGHEDISATQVYLSATRNRIKDVYDKAHPRAK